MRKIYYTLRISQNFSNILIAINEDKAITAVLLGEDSLTLVNDLTSLFPNDDLIYIEDDTTKDEIFDFLEIPTNNHHFNLELEGSEFQKKVWNEIANIKYGHTMSYTDLANKLGIGKSARAVASACGKNKIAILIPCHRVTNINGKNTGYRWGLERKETLLNLEKSKF